MPKVVNLALQGGGSHGAFTWGVSGISTRLCERPEGRRLFDILRGGDTLVVRWVDRLGRNYEDVTDAVREFIRRGIRIETVINRMTFEARHRSDAASDSVFPARVHGCNGAITSGSHQGSAESRNRSCPGKQRRDEFADGSQRYL